MDIKSQIEAIIMEDIRPRTRVDGGDIVFNSYENGTVTVTAHGDCASCPCCSSELGGWIEGQIQKKLGLSVQVQVRKKVPYYAR